MENRRLSELQTGAGRHPRGQFSSVDMESEDGQEEEEASTMERFEEET